MVCSPNSRVGIHIWAKTQALALAFDCQASILSATNRVEGESMTLEEILAALPNLTEEELEAVDHTLYELDLKASRERLERRSLEPDLPPRHWTKVFEDWTGKGEGDFPEDFSFNHDHYIHGAPKKW
jgi:hypothetical protein